MTVATWSSVALLDDTHDISAFTTGLDTVDNWFHTHAQKRQSEGRIATHLCLSGEGQIIAFYSLKHILVNLTGESSKLRKTAEANTSSADDPGWSTALLLALMGVRADLHGQGVGKHVVTHILQEAANLHRKSPFSLLIVDAENPKLVPFYEKYTFKLLNRDRRLGVKMSLVRRTAEQRPCGCKPCIESVAPSAG